MRRKPDPKLFERLLAEPEGEWIEFKDSWFDPNGIGRYASALANSARLAGSSAGYLVWGVANDGSVVGTNLRPRLRVVQQQPFEYWLKKRLAPADHEISFHDGQINGLSVVALATEAADRVPVRFDGIPYIRVGSATPPLADHPDKEMQLLAALAASNFESDAAREHVTAKEVLDLLDVDAAATLLDQPPPTGPDEAIRQLERFGLLGKEGGAYWAVTNLGAILFARSLNDFGVAYERKAPRVIFYRGENRVQTDSEQTGVKGYAIGFDGMTRFLERNLPKREQINGARRFEEPVYPVLAVRGLTANALIHQDFAVSGAGPLIEVFDRRIEVSNPGIPLIDVDRLIDEPPRSRNEGLARLMRQIGYCEERGSGIDKIIFTAEAAQLPPPAFAVGKGTFTGTLYSPRTFGEMTSDERLRACYQHACLQWVSGGQAMTNAAQAFRIDAVPVEGLNEPITVAVPLGESAKSVDALLAAPPSADTKSGRARDLILDILDAEAEQESDALDARVAQETGLAAGTVRNVRMKLKDEGLVKVYPFKDEHGKILRWYVARTGAPRSTTSA